MPSHANPASPVTIGTQPLHEPDVAANAVNSATGAYDDGPALPKVDKVVLLMDLVESVRLMAQDESGAVARWTVFVQKANALIPRYNGRVVKSLGDGLLAEFNHSRDAVQVALALHQIIKPANLGRDPEQHLFLRIGINATPVYVGNDDIYGSGVNLAARLAGLAGPGETIVSASVRDQLTDGLDAEVDDMGECYLKHIAEPVRAYRVGPAGPRPVLMPVGEYAAQLQPTIAVIPFTARSNEPEHFAIGELIADGVIGQLSRTRELKVISRLSATAFRGRTAQHTEIKSHLGTSYVLSGSYAVVGKAGGGKLVLMAELSDASTQEILWSAHLDGHVGDLLQAQSELLRHIAEAIHEAVFHNHVEMVLRQPLPSLSSYSLMIGGISLMHRSANQDFHTSRIALEELVTRDSNLHIAHAWLAKWHVLRVTRGMVSTNLDADIATALKHTHTAQESEAARSLALAMEGFVQVHLKRDFEAGINLFESAIQINPSEPLAWLFSGVAHSFLAHPSEATFASDKALQLSPMDPLLYYFEALAASSALCAGEFERAIALCECSLRRNKAHMHTHRALITALWEAGKIAQAKAAASILLRLFPGYTVQRFTEQSASGHTRFGQTMRHALLSAGVPLR